MDPSAVDAVISWFKENPSSVPEHLKAQLMLPDASPAVSSVDADSDSSPSPPPETSAVMETGASAVDKDKSVPDTTPTIAEVSVFESQWQCDVQITSYS